MADNNYNQDPGNYNQYQQPGYQQPGYQQPDYQQYAYQQPPQPNPYGPNPAMKPNTNLVWAILTTLFCCLPFGIVSIVYAAKVDSLWYAGNYAEAQDASKKAGTWAIVSAASAVGIWIIYLIVAVCIAGAAFSLVPFANL